MALSSNQIIINTFMHKNKFKSHLKFQNYKILNTQNLVLKSMTSFLWNRSWIWGHLEIRFLSSRLYMVALLVTRKVMENCIHGTEWEPEGSEHITKVWKPPKLAESYGLDCKVVLFQNFLRQGSTKRLFPPPWCRLFCRWGKPPAMELSRLDFESSEFEMF